MNKKQINDFFKRRNIKENLSKMVAFLVKDKSNIPVCLNLEGRSFTDGKSITIGLPRLFFNADEQSIFNCLKALTGHESAHIMNSDFNIFKRFIKEQSKYLLENYKIEEEIGIKIAKHIFNSVEDGRIENIISGQFNGIKKYIMFLNLTFWENSDISKNELQDFLFAITNKSVLGIFQKSYSSFYKGSEGLKYMEEISPLINKGVLSNSASECSKICEKIIKIIAPYLVKHLEGGNSDFLKNMNLNEDSGYSTTNPQNDLGKEKKDAREIQVNPDEVSSSLENIKNEIMKESKELSKNKKEGNFDINFKEINKGINSDVQFKSFKVNNTLVKSSSETKCKSKNLKKTIEEIFKAKNINIRKQKRGMLDTNQIWSIGINDYNIFYKNLTSKNNMAVFYILVDASGSMYGRKYTEAMKACAVIEESVQGYIPLKVSLFNSYNNYCKHMCIKDFIDNKRYNMSESAMKDSLYVNGKNKDGYSIRVATNELKNRKEENKVLIVLSDGLPSDYPSGKEGLDDVRKAVEEARKTGVKVFSIFFGEKEDRTNHARYYKYMYKNSIISCETEFITKNLIKIFKKTFY